MKLEYEPRQLALEFVVLTNMVYSMCYGFMPTCRGLALERTEKPPEETLRGYFFICWSRAGFPKHGPNPKAMKENTGIYGCMTDKNLCMFKEAIYKLNV